MYLLLKIPSVSLQDYTIAMEKIYTRGIYS